MFPNNRKQESADCKLPPRFSFQSRLNSLSKVTGCFSLKILSGAYKKDAGEISRKKGAVGRFADRFTLSVLLEPLSVPSLFRGEWRKPNSPSHRAGCCECFHPLPIRNSERPFAVRPPCFRQLPQTLPLKCTASVLCKFSSSYSQNSAFNNLCSFGSPLDNLRWVSQK